MVNYKYFLQSSFVDLHRCLLKVLRWSKFLVVWDYAVYEDFYLVYTQILHEFCTIVDHFFAIITYGSCTIYVSRVSCGPLSSPMWKGGGCGGLRCNYMSAGPSRWSPQLRLSPVVPVLAGVCPDRHLAAGRFCPWCWNDVMSSQCSECQSEEIQLCTGFFSCFLWF